jgi:hypothetical protein
MVQACAVGRLGALVPVAPCISSILRCQIFDMPDRRLPCPSGAKWTTEQAYRDPTSSWCDEAIQPSNRTISDRPVAAETPVTNHGLRFTAHRITCQCFIASFAESFFNARGPYLSGFSWNFLRQSLQQTVIVLP